MSKKHSIEKWLLKVMMLVTAFLFGFGSSQAQSVTFPSGGGTTKFTPESDGYVLITFDGPVDMTGAHGIFYTWNPSWGADVTMTAVESNGVKGEMGNVSGYGPYQEYTGVTKVVYEVKGGTVYCVWNSPESGTISFSTVLPDLNGGGGGEEMGTFPSGGGTTKFTPESDGYVLITFDGPVDMTGAHGIFYTWNPSWGADVTMTAVESNGVKGEMGNVSGYGPYQEYTGVTKVVYEVKGGTVYCVWNSPESGTVYFFNEMPDLDSVGGGGNTPAVLEGVYLALGSSGTTILSSQLNPSTDLQFVEGDGFYTVNFEADKTNEIDCGFVIYAVYSDGKRYSIGKVVNDSNGAPVSLSVPEGSKSPLTFGPYSDIKMIRIVDDNQSCYTLGGYFEKGIVDLKLNADFTELEVTINFAPVVPKEITFQVSGPYQSAGLQILDNDFGTVSIPSSESWTTEFEDGEQYYFVYDENYEVTITNNTVEEEENSTYFVSDPDSLDGTTSLTLTLWSGAAGSTFTINVVDNNPPSAMVNKVTFNITGETSQLVMMSMGEEPDALEITNPLVFEYEGSAGIMIAAQDGYVYTFSCNVESDGQGGNYVFDGVGPLAGYEQAGVAQGMLTLLPGANGYTFNINVTEAKEDEPVDFEKFTVTPEGPYEEIYGLTFTWDYPVQILDASKIYIQAPDYSYYYGGTGLNCSVEGNKLIIDVVNGPIKNNTTYEAWTFAGVENGGISVNGQTLENEGYGVSVQLTWAPGGIQVPDPVSIPATGTTPSVASISDITLSWPGFYVASDTGNKNLANILSDIKLYTGPLGQKFSPGWNEEAFTAQNVKSIEGVGTPVNGGFYPQVKITLNEPLENDEVGYTLYIPAWSLLFYEADSQEEVSQPDEVALYYCVSSIITLPGQYQRVNAKQFKGLQITGGDYTVKDADQVALYMGWFDTLSALQSATPLANGVDASSDGNILITFPAAGELYDAAYTIYVPATAIEGYTVKTLEGQPANMIQFTIEGNPATIDAAPVSSDPVNDATVETLESVKIWWGEYNRLTAPNTTYDPVTQDGDLGSVTGTMSVDGGQAQNVTFEIKSTLQGEADDDGNIDGANYAYELVYTPQSPIVAAGKYTFTIPANALNVYINQFSNPKNNEVVVNYTVTGADVPAEWNVTFKANELATSDEEIFMMLNSGLQTVSFRNGAYSLKTADSSVEYYLMVSNQYDLSVTSEGVESGADTFTMTVNGGLTDDNYTVYDFTVYPGMDGKTIDINVTKKVEVPTANKLYVAMGPDMDNIVANPASDAVLELQPDGSFTGSFEVEKGTANTSFCFYSIDSEGKYTYYAGESGGYAANWKLDFSTNTTISYNDLMSWTKSGSWTVTEYPAGYIGGVITATVNLPTSEGENLVPGTVNFAFNATIAGTPDLPAELLVLVDNSEYGSFSLTTSPATFKLTEDGTYEGDFNVGNNSYFKFYGVDNGAKTWYASSGMFSYLELDFAAQPTYEFSTISTATNSAMGVGGWKVSPNTTVHAVVDLVKKTVVLSNGEGSEGPGEVYPATVYIAWGTNNSDVSIGAYDHAMVTEEDGIYTASFDIAASDAKRTFRLYDDVNGVITYYSVQNGTNPWGMDENINLKDALSFDYTGLFALADTYNAGSWTFKFSEDVTKGTATLTLNLVEKTLNVVFVPAPELNKVTFNFSGDVSKFNLAVFDEEEGDLTPVTITGNTLEYTYGNQLALLSLSTAEGYSFSFQCDEPEAENTYQFRSNNLMAGYEENDVDQAMLGLYSGANGYTFNITVTEAKEDIFTFGQPEEILPANNSVINGYETSNIQVSWDSFIFAGINVPGKKYLGTDGLTVKVNGVVNNTWKNFMDAGLTAYNVMLSNEGVGGSEESQGCYLLVDLGLGAADWTGEITITIAEGLIANTTGEYNPEITLTYLKYGLTSGDVDNVTWTPAQGTQFLPNTVTFSAEWGEGDVTEIASLDNVFLDYNDSRIYLTENEVSIADGKLVFELKNLYELGAYSLYLEEGSVIVNNTLANMPATYSFSIVDEIVVPELPEAVSNPEDGTVTNNLDDHVSVTWEGHALDLQDGSLVTMTCNGVPVEIASVTLADVNYNGEGSTPDTGDGDGSGEAGIDNTLVVNFSEWLMTPGTYVLTIPAGTVQVNVGYEWYENTEVSFTYTVVESKVVTTIEPEVTYADGKVTMTWDDCDIQPSDNFELYIDYANDETIVLEFGEACEIVDGALVIDLNKVQLPDGNFKVTLVQGSVEIDEDGETTVNAQVTKEFEYSAVAAIFAGDDYIRVFNLNGVNVLNTDNAADLNLLEGGLYIINGKKVLVKNK